MMRRRLVLYTALHSVPSLTMVKEEAKNVDDLETDEDDIHPPPPQPKALVTANNSKGSRFAKPTASRAKPVIPNKIVTVKSGAATVKRNSVVSNVSDPPPPAIDTLSQSSSNGDLIAEEVEDDPIITDVIITIEPPPPPPLPPSSETTTAIVVGHRKSWVNIRRAFFCHFLLRKYVKSTF